MCRGVLVSEATRCAVDDGMLGAAASDRGAIRWLFREAFGLLSPYLLISLTPYLLTAGHRTCTY